MNGVFIVVEVDPAAFTAAQAAEIARLCPVDIFSADNGQLSVRLENQDECTLCELCLRAALTGTIRIHKRYSGEVRVSDGES
jgi:NAD-dependent dihydropyrimidine dehydrogenase PreA subunit